MKVDRLKSFISIREIFSNGRSQLKFPILAKWSISPTENKGQAGLYFTPTVSVKKIRKAVDRNLIKRRIKEAVRNDLKKRGNLNLSSRIEVVYIFLHNQPLPYDQILKAVTKINSKIFSPSADSIP
ncbi:MAG: hypothetical protein EA409_01245 [Saprospirales bacterium]|jgi:ribonuclease P protein component|nr:MAG: hypothetical protein EA409_01245 [Saprospirales bacterium]